MIDWESALSVATMGIVSVFLVLGTLSVVVAITGKIVKKVEAK